MKPATIIYIEAIEYLREVAKELGYAIAVHGSMARDLDLVAIPWSESASDAQILVEALQAKLKLCTSEKWYFHFQDPTDKPHGRRVWTLTPGCGGKSYIDLSVMPLFDDVDRENKKVLKL